MSSELRVKKLRGSGGYVVAGIDDDQQMKGNLGGPDLFLAPIGRLEEESISRYFCNACEKEFEGAPKIQYESPNELVADNLTLVEKGQYKCGTCSGTIAEYREFKKQDDAAGAGFAKPIESSVHAQETVETMIRPESVQETTPQAAETEQMAAPQQASASASDTSKITPIEGMAVFDENASRIGNAERVGVDSKKSVVLIVARDDGAKEVVTWNKIKKIGEVILLGNSREEQDGGSEACTSCGFVNKEGSKFCEECGAKI